MYAIISPEGVTVGVVQKATPSALEAVVKRVEAAAFRERAKRFEEVMLDDDSMFTTEQQREMCKEYLIAELTKRLNLYTVEKIG